MLSLFTFLLFTGAVFAQDTMNIYRSTDPTATPTVSITPSVSPSLSPSPSPTLTPTPTNKAQSQTQVGVGGGPDDSSLPLSAPHTGSGGLSN